MARRSRDNSIDSLPEELRRQVRAMLSDRAHRWRYADIMDRVYHDSGGEHRLSTGALSRYYNNVLQAELDEVERRTEFSMKLAATVTEVAKAGDPEDMEALILNVIDASFLANEADAAATSPVDLLRAKAALMRVQNQREQLRLRERELGAQLEKLAIEKEKAERELAMQRAADQLRREQAERALAAAEGGGENKTRELAKRVREIYGIPTGDGAAA